MKQILGKDCVEEQKCSFRVSREQALLLRRQALDWSSVNMSKLDFITLGSLSILTNAISRVLLTRHYFNAWIMGPSFIPIEIKNAYHLIAPHIYLLQVLF